MLELSSQDSYVERSGTFKRQSLVKDNKVMAWGLSSEGMDVVLLVSS